MTTTYTVVAVIQSANIDAGEPVNVNWYSGDSLAQAMSAMVMAVAHHENVPDNTMPESIRTRLLSVRLDITEGATPSTTRCKDHGKDDHVCLYCGCGCAP